MYLTNAQTIERLEMTLFRNVHEGTASEHKDCYGTRAPLLCTVASPKAQRHDPVQKHDLGIAVTSILKILKEYKSMTSVKQYQL